MCLSQGESQQVPASPAHALRLVSGSPSHMVQAVFKLVFSALDPRVTESAQEPFKNGFFFPYSTTVFLDIIPIVFQTQAFGGFIAPVQGLRVGVPDVEHKALTPYGKIRRFLKYLSILDHCSWSGVLCV